MSTNVTIQEKQNSCFFIQLVSFVCQLYSKQFSQTSLFVGQERSMPVLTQYLWKQILQAAHFTKSPTQSGRWHLQWRFIGIDLCLVLLRFQIFGRLGTIGKHERLPDSKQDCKCVHIFLVSKPTLGFKTPFMQNSVRCTIAKKTTVYHLSVFEYQLNLLLSLGRYFCHTLNLTE